MRGYHFFSLRDDCGFGDRRVYVAPPPDGQWVMGDHPLMQRQARFVASEHPFDALRYGAGDNLAIVELGGEIAEGVERSVATRARIIKRIDATELLREYARWCALQVLHLWDAPESAHTFLSTGDDWYGPAARDAANDAIQLAQTRAGRNAARAALYAVLCAPGPNVKNVSSNAWKAAGAASKAEQAERKAELAALAVTSRMAKKADQAWAAFSEATWSVTRAAETARMETETAQRDKLQAMVDDAFNSMWR